MPAPLRIVLIVVATGIVVLGGLWLLQRRLIYFPTGDPGPRPPGWTQHTVTTDDGIDLEPWVHEPPPDRPVVVVFNGNAGNRGDRLALGRGLADRDLGVVLFDYRGYGGQDGSPTEAGLRMDATAIGMWVADRYPDRRLVYLGESLGAAVAAGLATTLPPDLLVLRSPFTSLAAAASANYPIPPLGTVLWDDYDTLAAVRDLDVPVVVVVGSEDRIVPPDQSRDVYDAAPQRVDFVIVEGAGHNDSILASGTRVVDALLEAVAGLP